MTKFLITSLLIAFMVGATSLVSTAQTNAANNITGTTTTQGPTAGSTTGKDLAASLPMSSEHSTLGAMLNVSGLASQAKGAGPYTVFAPANSAFAKLPSGMRDNLLKTNNHQKLISVITHHVVAGSFRVADLTDGQQLKTVQGDMLTVKKQGDVVMLTDSKGNTATITTPDIMATNGVIHSIDTVLMPN